MKIGCGFDFVNNLSLALSLPKESPNLQHYPAGYWPARTPVDPLYRSAAQKIGKRPLPSFFKKIDHAKNFKLHVRKTFAKRILDSRQLAAMPVGASCG